FFLGICRSTWPCESLVLPRLNKMQYSHLHTTVRVNHSIPQVFIAPRQHELVENIKRFRDTKSQLDMLCTPIPFVSRGQVRALRTWEGAGWLCPLASRS